MNKTLDLIEAEHPVYLAVGWIRTGEHLRDDENLWAWAQVQEKNF